MGCQGTPDPLGMVLPPSKKKGSAPNRPYSSQESFRDAGADLVPGTSSRDCFQKAPSLRQDREPQGRVVVLFVQWATHQMSHTTPRRTLLVSCPVRARCGRSSLTPGDMFQGSHMLGRPFWLWHVQRSHDSSVLIGNDVPEHDVRQNPVICGSFRLTR